MTDEGLSKLLAAIVEEYGQAFSGERAELWSLALADVADDDGFRVFGHHLRTNRFPPHPADLRAAIFGDAKQTEARLDDEADAAIRHLEANVSDYEAVNLGAELNAIVRQMGGPDAIVGEIRSGEWKFRREEARRLYKSLVKNGVPAHLASPEWPERPHRVNGPEDVPQLQDRRFTPALPAPQREALPEKVQ